MTRLLLNALGAISVLLLAVASAVLTPGCELECGSSFCGCWQPMTLSFSTQVIEPDGGFVTGADVQCIGGDHDGGKPPTVTTDAQGRASLSVRTMESPGCGIADCNRVRVTRSDAGFAEFRTEAVNGRTATMPIPDGGP
ncbi:MAG: hypothetical protein ACYC8T_12655 [Myxococcaceae bacterium]